MESYFRERSQLFNAGSTFSCPDACERFGCREVDLHISMSLTDLLALSWADGRPAADLFIRDCKVAFDPSDEDPWFGRLTLELIKPCHFLDGKRCRGYPGRPIACALFPESRFVTVESEKIVRKELFRKFPCLQTPCTVSPARRSTIQQLLGVAAKESLLSDLYLFGISPFLVDLKTVAGEVLEGLAPSAEGVARLPLRRLETLLRKHLSRGGYIDEWKAKIERLDKEGFGALERMERTIDQTAPVVRGSRVRMAYQFDGDRLIPIRLTRDRWLL